MTMPGDIFFDSGTTYFGSNLTAYVNNGTIPESRVDDRAADRTVYGYGHTLYGLYMAISVPSSVPYASTSVTLTVRYVV